MVKPRILTVTEDGFSGDVGHYVVNRIYGDVIREAGGLLFAAFDVQNAALYADAFDGLLLTGGQDIHAYRFGDLYRDFSEMARFSRTRDDLEFTLCEAFINLKKPVFGIGRGMEVLNTVLGGTLYKDIRKATGHKHPDENAPEKGFNGLEKAEFSSHGLIWDTESRLYGVTPDMNVCAGCHHMAVDMTGKGLKAVASAPDGIIEAVEHETEPWFGVMWHPERDAAGIGKDIRLFEYFLSLCRTGDKKPPKPMIMVNGGQALDRMFHDPSFTVNKTYTAAITAGGGIPFTPMDTKDYPEYAEIADGLLLTGSTSFRPDDAGDVTFSEEQNRNPLDHRLIDAFLDAGKPILGVCLGLQQLNAHFGGTLDVNFKLRDGIEHMMTKHRVRTEEGSIIRELFGEEFYVNSRHNIRLGEIGKGIRVTARAIPDSQVVEAIEHISLPISAYQWHPERMRGDFPEPPEGPDMTPLFADFIGQCNKKIQQDT